MTHKLRSHIDEIYLCPVARPTPRGNSTNRDRNSKRKTCDAQEHVYVYHLSIISQLLELHSQTSGTR